MLLRVVVLREVLPLAPMAHLGRAATRQVGLHLNHKVALHLAIRDELRMAASGEGLVPSFRSHMSTSTLPLGSEHCADHAG